MKKRLLALGLAIVMTLSLALSASAAKPDDGDDGIAPCVDRYEWDAASMYNNGRRSNTFDFELTANYAHAKIFIVNRSASTVNIQIRKGSPTGTLVSDTTYKLASGYQNTFNVHANGNYDMYYCTVSTADGSILYGEITIRTATTMEKMS